MKIGFITKAIRYFAASALALIVDTGILYGCIKLFNTPYLWAATLGFSIGCLVNYIASKLYVFENHSANSESVTVTLFVLVGVAGLLLNNLILYIGVDLLSLHILFSKFVSAGAVFCFNFLIRGFFVFKDPDLCKTQ